jgi:hypothetical protein
VQAWALARRSSPSARCGHSSQQVPIYHNALQHSCSWFESPEQSRARAIGTLLQACAWYIKLGSAFPSHPGPTCVISMFLPPIHASGSPWRGLTSSNTPGISILQCSGMCAFNLRCPWQAHLHPPSHPVPLLPGHQLGKGADQVSHTMHPHHTQQTLACPGCHVYDPA